MTDFIARDGHCTFHDLCLFHVSDPVTRREWIDAGFGTYSTLGLENESITTECFWEPIRQTMPSPCTSRAS